MSSHFSQLTVGATALARSVGVIRSAFKERKSVPRLGAAGAVELFREYVAGLHRLDKHSHLWVLVWLDKAERDVLQVVPRGIADQTEENLHGVFAVRSPVRPNPIGMTVAQVLRVEGPRIEFDRLDFMDGTPVLDLKPYFLSREAVYSATNEQIGKPADREALRESLCMQAVNFHGETCPDLDLAVDILTHFRADVLDMLEPRSLRVTVPLDRPHLIDAFIGMTRATPGRGTLSFSRGNSVRLDQDGGAEDYKLTPEALVKGMEA